MQICYDTAATECLYHQSIKFQLNFLLYPHRQTTTYINSFDKLIDSLIEDRRCENMQSVMICVLESHK